MGGAPGERAADKSIRIPYRAWQEAKLAAVSRGEHLGTFVARAIRAEVLIASVGPLPGAGLTVGQRAQRRRVAVKRKVVAVRFQEELF